MNDMALKLETILTLFVFVLLDKCRGLHVSGINRYLTLFVHRQSGVMLCSHMSRQRWYSVSRIP